MHAREIERAAYIAAHGILAADTGSPELACPGARRTHAVDVIAGIIRGVFELYNPESEARPGSLQTPRPEVVREIRRPALMLEISRQTALREGAANSEAQRSIAVVGD
jgi:hypothetical protein